MAFSVEVKGAKELERDLKTFAQKAVPYAVRNALTTQAFEARKIWQGEIRKAYTLRNQYTERSIIAEKARGNFPGTIASKVGSFADYMDEQEEGAVVTGKGGARKAIPGPVAAGLPPGAKRTRVVRAAARLGVLHVAHPGVTGSRARQNAAAIRMAIQRNNRVALLERKDGSKALFRIVGGQQRWRGKRFTTRKLKVSLLYGFRGSVRVPPARTMAKAIKALEPKIDHINQAALLEQLRRHRVLGY